MNRNILYLLLGAFFITSCLSTNATVEVVVSNPTDIERKLEVVEVSLNDIYDRVNPGSSDNIIVTNKLGDQIPYQLIYNGEDQPSALIFAVSLDAHKSDTVIIKKGTPEEFSPLVYGRLVPERKDDFTWENNLVAYRVYGPALEETGEISGGLDIWVKKTENLVIDKWYKDDLAGIASYHEDHGEGVDFYKVGPTLGLGMTAPYYDNKLCLGKNFTEANIIENGPLRFTFELKYAPYMVGNDEIVESRIISLEANKHLNKVIKTFNSSSSDLTLATGLVMSGESENSTYSDKDNGIIAYQLTEDTNNGIIFTGVINPIGFSDCEIANGHFLGFNSYSSGESYTYYTGGGWNKYGFDSFDSWINYLQQQREIINNPIIITIN